MSFEKFCNYLSYSGYSKISGASQLSFFHQANASYYVNNQSNSTNHLNSNKSSSKINIENLREQDRFLETLYFQKMPYVIKDQQVEKIADQYFNPLNLC